MTAAPAGIAVGPVTDWFTRRVAGVRPPLDFELVLGGRSNLTYVVTDTAGARWVLRRPPTGHVLPSAHNVLRERAILAGLAGTAVPVPAVAGYCADPAVTGADFYVMDFVDGVILNSDDEVAAIADPAQASRNMVDTLVAIHRVDCGRAPFAELARPGGYLPRQLRRWIRQLDVSGSGNVALREVAALLSRDIPPQRRTGLVHGDFRPGNLILGADGAVRAVLDWELSAVGDVLADLGWLVAVWASPVPIGWAPDPADGFLSAGEIVDCYRARTGCDVTDITYYHAFALWRLGCIADGVYQRYSDGAMGVHGVHLDEMAARPGLLAELARQVLAGR